MSRWLLALLFAFGTVTFLTGCPAGEEEEAPVEDVVDDAEEGAKEMMDKGEDMVDEVAE